MTFEKKESLLGGVWRREQYVSPDAAQKLKLYKYAGGDEGILYVYFYNPASKALVEYLPDTLAPNVITLVGFLFSVVPCFYLFWNYGLDFSTPVPASFCYANALCYLIYRMLDEMDGKQARRTGNSSPLGLLFDHGCDAFTCGLQAFIFAKITLVGEGVYPQIAVYLAQTGFFFATLEEYYTGALYLYVGNGVTDGSALLIGINLVTAYYGSEFWLAQVPFVEMQLSHFFFWMIVVMCFMMSLQNMRGIMVAFSKPIEKEEFYREKVDLVTLFRQTVAYLGIIFAYALFANLQPQILRTETNLMFAISFSFMGVHMAMSTMLAHLTQQTLTATNKLYYLNIGSLAAMLAF